MPSFDIVSEVDEHELANAVDQASRELTTRFDFRGVDAGFALEKTPSMRIVLHAPEDFRLEQMIDILRDKLVRRKVDPRCLDASDTEGAGRVRRQELAIRQGIDHDASRDIVRRIKDSKLKVQAAIHGEKVRVTGKKRDDLQAVMQMLRDAELPLPLQFDNFRD
jgi:hypothetical protein